MAALLSVGIVDYPLGTAFSPSPRQRRRRYGDTAKA
jgi:hypothetical protein